MARPVFIIDGSRTPFLKARSGPGPFTPVDLAVQCGRPLLARQPFAPDAFDQVILGCVNVIADEMNPARVAALRLGMGEAMVAFTVQINCGSGMQSIDTGYRYIREGISDLILAGGAEALSHAPLVWPQQGVRWFAGLAGAKGILAKLAALAKARPSYFKPIIGLERGLTDPITELNMGQTAEVVGHLFGITARKPTPMLPKATSGLPTRKRRVFSGARSRPRSRATANSTTTTTACGRIPRPRPLPN
jgi:acetyl-CoA C-acetyltransferase